MEEWEREKELHSRARQLVIRTPNRSDSRGFSELEPWIPAQRQWSEKFQVVVEWWTDPTDDAKPIQSLRGDGGRARVRCEGGGGMSGLKDGKMLVEVAGYSRPEYEEHLHGHRRSCVHFILY